MKAKDAVVGQWYQDVQWGRTLSCGTVNPQTMLHAFAIREGESTVMRYFGENREIEHLPDCTGWDWQPAPKHPPIPPGYRLVDKDKDAPKRGDDMYAKDCVDNQWRRVSSVIDGPVGTCGFLDRHTYIRRIEPQLPDPGEGWRIASGEDCKNERCEYWHGDSGEWRQRVGSSVGARFIGRVCYRVPVEPQYREFANSDEVLPFWNEPVFDKATGNPKTIISAGANGITIGRHTMSYDVAFDEYRFSDRPFGVKVQ